MGCQGTVFFFFWGGGGGWEWGELPCLGGSGGELPCLTKLFPTNLNDLGIDYGMSVSDFNFFFGINYGCPCP